MLIAEPSDGSAENIDRLIRGTAELGIALADTAAEHRGALVSLGRVYQNYLQCIVLRDSPFRQTSDLVGGRVSVGAPGSGTSLSSRRTLAALDLATPASPIELLELNLADAVEQLEAGSIDAVMWSGGIPVPELSGLALAGAVTLIDLQPSLPRLTREFGAVYQPASIPPAVYSSREPLPAIAVGNLLLSRPDFPDDSARALVDTLVDDAEALITLPTYGVHFLSPPTLIGTSPIPLHPAAQRRFAERYG